jgi:hypothetical protein
MNTEREMALGKQSVVFNIKWEMALGKKGCCCVWIWY